MVLFSEQSTHVCFSSACYGGLDGLVVKPSASRAADLGTRFPFAGAFFRPSNISDLKIGCPLAGVAL